MLLSLHSRMGTKHVAVRSSLCQDHGGKRGARDDHDGSTTLEETNACEGRGASRGVAGGAEDGDRGGQGSNTYLQEARRQAALVPLMRGRKEKPYRFRPIPFILVSFIRLKENRICFVPRRLLVATGCFAVVPWTTVFTVADVYFAAVVSTEGLWR